MTDLLVSSLMADGGLKTSLLASIKVEMAELEKTGEKEDKEGDTLMTEQSRPSWSPSPRGQPRLAGGGRREPAPSPCSSWSGSS